MKVANYKFEKFKNSTAAKKALIRLLQNAHAGEKAAANAYYGHAHSLFITDAQEKLEILKIYAEELHHRQRLKELLNQLDSKPRLSREILMWLIGAFIAMFSYFGTWFIPMYGAGLLESSNIGEYEVAARLALLANEQSLIDELLRFAEIEKDHEYYFRQKVLSHPLAKWIPIWDESISHEKIRISFSEFKQSKSLL